jgi:hypothetical protein
LFTVVRLTPSWAAAAAPAFGACQYDPGAQGLAVRPFRDPDAVEGNDEA